MRHAPGFFLCVAMGRTCVRVRRCGTHCMQAGRAGGAMGETMVQALHVASLVRRDGDLLVDVRQTSKQMENAFDVVMPLPFGKWQGRRLDSLTVSRGKLTWRGPCESWISAHLRYAMHRKSHTLCFTLRLLDEEEELPPDDELGASLERLLTKLRELQLEHFYTFDRVSIRIWAVPLGKMRAYNKSVVELLNTFAKCTPSILPHTDVKLEIGVDCEDAVRRARVPCLDLPSFETCSMVPTRLEIDVRRIEVETMSIKFVMPRGLRSFRFVDHNENQRIHLKVYADDAEGNVAYELVSFVATEGTLVEVKGSGAWLIPNLRLRRMEVQMSEQNAEDVLEVVQHIKRRFMFATLHASLFG